MEKLVINDTKIEVSVTENQCEILNINGVTFADGHYQIGQWEYDNIVQCCDDWNE